MPSYDNLLPELSMKIWTEIRDISIEELKAMQWAENPRTMDRNERKALDASLEKFGLSIPFVVNESNGMLLSGHQRLESAENNGAETVQALYVDLSEDDAQALALVLNNQSAQGEWDDNKLSTIVSRIRERGPGNLRAAGFDHNDVERIIASARASIPKVPPKMPVQPVASPAPSEGAPLPPSKPQEESAPLPPPTHQAAPTNTVNRPLVIKTDVVFSLALPKSQCNWVARTLGASDEARTKCLIDIANEYMGAK